MARYPVSKALKCFSEILDRAMAGEEVVITRHGFAIVRIAPIRPGAQEQIGLDWLVAKRTQRDED